VAIRTTGVRYDVIAKDSASKTFDKIGKQAGRTDSTLGKVAKSAAKYGAVMGGTMAAGLAVAADKAVNFQAEMLKISTQAGGTTKDVGILSKQVLTLGKTAEQGPDQLADSMYHLKSIGLDNVSAMKDLKVASDLAAVGNSDLEETTNALGGAWRSGIKGAETFSKSAATVNAVIGAGNMRMQDFVAAIGTGILPSAKSFGLSLQSVGSALALMTDEGIPATDAATRLRMSISLLGAPSEKAEKQLKRIGLSGTALAKEMRSPAGLVGTIGLLKDKLDASGLSAVEQSQLISRAFGGGRSSSGILTLLNNYDVLVKKQDQINASMAKFPKAVQAQRQTVAAQLNLIKSNLAVAAIQIGDKVLPLLSDAVVYLNTTALPAIGKVTTSLENLVPINKIERDFGTVTGFVSDFVTGLKGPQKVKVKPEWDKSKPFAVNEGLIPSLPKVKAKPAPKPFPITEGLIPSLPQQKKAVSQGQQLGDQLRTALTGGIQDSVKTLDWKKLGRQIGTGLDTAFAYVADHSKQLGNKVSDSISQIDWVKVGKGLGSTALPLSIGFVDNLFQPLFTVDFWEKHWLDTIIAVLSVLPVGKVVDAVGAGVSKLPWGKLGDLVGDGLSKVPWGKSLDWAKWIGRTSTSLWTAVSHFVAMFGSDFRLAVTQAVPKLGDWFFTELEYLPARVEYLGKDLGSSLERAVGDLVKKVPGMSHTFTAAVIRYWTRFTFYQTGVNLIAGLYDGVVAKLSGVGKWVKSHIIDPVVSRVESQFGIHSPSTVFAGIGGQLIAGLYVGVIDRLAGVGKWVGAHIKSPLVGALVSPSTWLFGKGKSVMTGFWDGLKQPWSDVQKWVSGVSKWIKDHKGPISLDRKLLVPAGKALMHGLLQGLKVGFKGVGSFVYKTGTTVANTVSKIAGSVFGADSTPFTGSAVGQAQKYAKSILSKYGWNQAEFGPLQQLWTQESGWRYNATNPSSGAYGIPQALPASKMASAGADWRTNAATQIRWGLSYIKSRYGDPVNAWDHEKSFGWYAKGGLAPIGQTAWVGERGPELMQVTPQGTRIYNNADSMAMARLAGAPIPGYASGTVANAQARVQEAREALERARERRIGIKAAETRLAAAKQELANAKRSTKATVANALSNGFLKSLETGTASAIASAVKSMNSKLQSAGAGSLVVGNLRTASKLESLANKRASLQSTISTARSYAADQASSLASYLDVSGTDATSMQGLLVQMQQGQSAAKHLASTVTKLRGMGLNKTLLGELADAGPGSQLAKILSGASAYDVKQLNALATSQSKLTTSFGNSLADAMYDSGKDASKGFLTGLQSQEKALQTEMNRLADGMVKSIKHRLGIHSPSRVTRDQVGKQVAMGAAVGVRMHTPQAVRATQRMADLMGAVQARTGGSAAGRVVAPAPVVHVHVHVQDQALADLIDTRVEHGVEAGHDELVEAFRAAGVM